MIKFSRVWHFQSAGEVPQLFKTPAGFLCDEPPQPSVVKMCGNHLQIACVKERIDPIIQDEPAHPN
jgi:hypothetical protein